jgi:hypothetical protein
MLGYDLSNPLSMLIVLSNTLYFRYYQIILNKYWKTVVGASESWLLWRQTYLTTRIMPYAEIVGLIRILNQLPKLVRSNIATKCKFNPPHCYKFYTIKWAFDKPFSLNIEISTNCNCNFSLNIELIIINLAPPDSVFFN